MLKRVVLVAMMFIGALAIMPAASAEEITCQSTMGPVTVDNLRVPEGATCTLNGTRVQGTVKVETQATLIARDIRVIGNIQAENAWKVTVKQGSRVGGDIQHVQGHSAKITETNIGGTLLFDENGGPLKAKRNVIEGNLQAFQNRGGVRIANNTIDENLQCKANEPAPTGGGNVVQGNKEDQCAGL